ncbi:uncharacterized protein [Dermacentor andersoni]|uniref:uncharacterized protein n=1 Tax=Dermacentor andersoni TaxID=34620 RepID=UPI00241630AA|nr:uncharacterized protein LOC129383954 [Dermacentor andersoni]
MAAFELIANALTALQDATQALSMSYDGDSVTLVIGNRVYRYTSRTLYLTGIKLARWLVACTLSLLRLILFFPSTPIFLLLVLVLLSLVFRRWCLGEGGPPEETRIPSVPPRSLTRPTSVEEEACLSLARRVRRHLRCTRHDAHHCFTRRIAEGRAMTEPVAARVIQRWVRARFQPWVRGRVVYSASASRPQREPGWWTGMPVPRSSPS